MKFHKTFKVLYIVYLFGNNLSSYTMDPADEAAQDYFSALANETKLHITEYIFCDPNTDNEQKQNSLRKLLLINRTTRDFMKGTFFEEYQIQSALTLFIAKNDPYFKFFLGSSRGKAYHNVVTQLSTIAQYIVLYHHKFIPKNKYTFPNTKVLMRAVTDLNNPSEAHLQQVRHAYQEEVAKNNNRKAWEASQYVTANVLYVVNNSKKIVDALLHNTTADNQDDPVLQAFKSESFNKRFNNKKFLEFICKQTQQLLEKSTNKSKRGRVRRHTV